MSTHKVEISRGKQGDMDRHFPTGTAEPGVIAPKADPSIQRQAFVTGPTGAGNRQLDDDETFDSCNFWKTIADDGYADWDTAVLETTSDDGSIHPNGTVPDGVQVAIGGAGGSQTVDVTSATGQPVHFVTVKNTHALNALDISINGNVIFAGVAAGAVQEIRTGGISTVTITSDGALAANADVLFAGHVVNQDN